MQLKTEKSTIKIEKGIPIKGTFYYQQFPFDQMTVGDSFLVPTEPNNKLKAQGRIAAAALHYTTHYHPKQKFSTRQVENGIRIWRVK